MRIHAIPHSANVQRVALALGLKGVPIDAWVEHDPGDRSGIRAVSGQELVPVLETDDGQVLTDSMPIVAWIDATWPDRAPLYPADARARGEVEAFVDFFDRVWKVSPNAIQAEQEQPAPDGRKIAAWGAQLRGWQHGFDGLLHDRRYLFGDTPGAADLCAYPFLKFAISTDPDDDDLFHGILIEHLAHRPGEHERLAGWIARMAEIQIA